MKHRLEFEDLEAFRRLDTCTVSNAIETFNVRLRSEGFADASIRCLFPARPASMVGHAATARIRSSSTPPAGHTYFDRTDWWNDVLSVPPPRVVVVQDIDSRPGFGAFVGEVHGRILAALGCVGLVTNGGVRDLHALERGPLQVFAGNVALSHAYVHLVDFGGPVEVGGLKVAPGDIIHGDRHGVQSIPREIAAQIPAVAQRLLCRDRRVIEFCQSPDFSVEKLRELIKDLG